MIILIYEWEQNREYIIIKIKLPVGTVSSTVDVKIGKELVNVSCPGNHLLRIYLKHEVYKTESKLIFQHGKLHLNIKKAEPGVWESLLHENAKDKKILTEKFSELIECERIEEVKRAETVRIEDRKNKNKSTEGQLSAEQRKRELRQEVKDAEKKAMTANIRESEENKTMEKENNSRKIQFNDCVADYKKSPFEYVAPQKSKMAPPRTRKKIQVTFTERVFPTPARETRKPEEDEWLQKQAKSRKAAEDFVNDLEPHEKVVGYLEDKGIKMMKNGDVEGALNAFDIAIKLFPLNAQLFMHRAATNLKLGNAIRAAQDAARAIEMFSPPVSANLPQRVQCHLLRGRSLRRLEMMTEALMDFTEALKLDPSNKQIENEAEEIRHYIQTNGDGWKEEWETDLTV